LVEALYVNEDNGGAKEKWPFRWCGRLGGGIRYILTSFL
jgi:hypothetical protein